MKEMFLPQQKGNAYLQMKNQQYKKGYIKNCHQPKKAVQQHRTQRRN